MLSGSTAARHRADGRDARARRCSPGTRPRRAVRRQVRLGVDRRPAGGLVAVPIEGEPVRVAADWLDGRTVRAVRVAARRGPDRHRLLGCRRRAHRRRRDHARRVRCAAAGRRADQRAGASLVDATAVVWVGRVDARRDRPSRPATPPCTTCRSPGRRARCRRWPKLAALAGGSVIYVTTTDGELRRFVEPTWAQVLGRRRARRTRSSRADRAAHSRRRPSTGAPARARGRCARSGA